MTLKKHVPRTPLVKYKVEDKTGGDRLRPAVFFEVDKFVRFFRPDLQKQHHDEFMATGKLPPVAPMNRGEQVLHSEAVAYLMDMQNKGYLLIGLSMEEQIGYVAQKYGAKAGVEMLNRMLDVQMETMEMLEGAGIRVAEILYCPHNMIERDVMGPDPKAPSKTIALEKKQIIQCKCHLPRRELIEGARRKYDLDIKRSVMIYVNEHARLAAIEFTGYDFFGEANHTNYVIKGDWRKPQATAIERRAAEALKKDIKAGSSGTMEALSIQDHGSLDRVKSLEDAMPNYTRVLHEEGLLE